jgi:hypothetical protein
VIVVCCKLEVFPTGRSFVRRSPSEYDVSKYDVSKYDLETSTLRRPGPHRAGVPQNKNIEMGQNRFNLSSRDFWNSVKKLWARLCCIMVRED